MRVLTWTGGSCYCQRLDSGLSHRGGFGFYDFAGLDYWDCGS